jgi:SPASM domain peptide maturase of grasp-with-spasm system
MKETSEGLIFRLHANCVPVRGARRSLICDLQYHIAHAIPNALYEILTTFCGQSIAEIKKHYTRDDEEIIDEYLDFLIEKGLGAWCDEPARFPPLDMSWDRAEKITNAIIDIDATSSHDYREILVQLDGLGCQAVQIRSYDALSVDAIHRILAAGKGLRLRHMDLLLKYDEAITMEIIESMVIHNAIISAVTFHTSPFSKRVSLKPYPVCIGFTTAAITPQSCGIVSPAYFSLGTEHFIEAHNYNSCLNRKVSICADGSIRACPSMATSYGSIKGTRLASVIAKQEFTQIGRITKDQVAVCRDCEFRYICTDCRAYTLNADDPYSKPAKCKYDPYSATWSTS